MRPFYAIICLIISDILLIGCGSDRVTKSNDTGFISGRATIDGMAAIYRKILLPSFSSSPGRFRIAPIIAG